jgi:hypothetical protein
MPSRKNRVFTRWSEFFYSLPPGAHMSQTMCRSLKKLMHQCPHDVPLNDWENLFLQINAVANRFDIPIDTEHENKGREWIRTQIRKIRKSCGLHSERVLFDTCNEIGIKHFYFGGYMDATPSVSKRIAPARRDAVPVWKVECNDGTRFSYAYGAWQGYDVVVVNPTDYVY